MKKVYHFSFHIEVDHAVTVLNTVDRTLTQHQIFEAVRDQIKDVFNTENSQVRNFGMSELINGHIDPSTRIEN